LRPATRTMKNSSRLLAEIDRNRTPLQQRVVWIGGFLQHTTVEMEPGKFPVDVTAAAIGREEPPSDAAS